MEGSDALTDEAIAAGEDPFEAVPADAGGEPDPDLVAPGELGGENPSEDPLAEDQPGDPLAEPQQGEFLEDPEAETSESDPEPEPEPEPTPEPPDPPEPAPEPAESPAEEPQAEAPADPAPEPAPEPEKPKRRRRAASNGAKKGEREYVVVQCDSKDKPTGIAGEVTARDDKTARRVVFEGMEEKTAHLVAVPARYWKVKTLKAEVEEVRKVSEE